MRPFQRILHPIDLNHLSSAAFCHALKLALAGADPAHPSLLELFHCETDGTASFTQFPQVRSRLIRWGILPDGAAKEDVVRLGLGIRKQISHGEVAEEIALETEKREFELMVMSSHALAGWSYFLHHSVSSSVVHDTQLPGLLLPPEASGFVNSSSGSLHLDKVLLPVAPDPDAWPALQAVSRLLHTLKPRGSGEVALVYVGREQDFPELSLPNLPAGWSWTRRTLGGDPVPVLSAFAKDWEPQLAGLSSAGQTSWKDRWFGSTAEQLLHEFSCPLLVAPGQKI